MKLPIPIAVWLLFAWMGPAVAAQTGSPTGRALLISDIHLDPLSDPAIVKQLIVSPVSRWESILQGSSRSRSRLTARTRTIHSLPPLWMQPPPKRLSTM